MHYIYSVLSPSTPCASAYLKAKKAEEINIKAGEKGKEMKNVRWITCMQIEIINHLNFPKRKNIYGVGSPWLYIFVGTYST